MLNYKIELLINFFGENSPAQGNLRAFKQNGSYEALRRAFGKLSSEFFGSGADIEQECRVVLDLARIDVDALKVNPARVMSQTFEAEPTNFIKLKMPNLKKHMFGRIREMFSLVYPSYTDMHPKIAEEMPCFQGDEKAKESILKGLCFFYSRNIILEQIGKFLVPNGTVKLNEPIETDYVAAVYEFLYGVVETVTLFKFEDHYLDLKKLIKKIKNFIAEYEAELNTLSVFDDRWARLNLICASLREVVKDIVSQHNFSSEQIDKVWNIIQPEFLAFQTTLQKGLDDFKLEVNQVVKQKSKDWSSVAEGKMPAYQDLDAQHQLLFDAIAKIECLIQQNAEKIKRLERLELRNIEEQRAVVIVILNSYVLHNQAVIKHQNFSIRTVKKLVGALHDRRENEYATPLARIATHMKNDIEALSFDQKRVAPRAIYM